MSMKFYSSNHFMSGIVVDFGNMVSIFQDKDIEIVPSLLIFEEGSGEGR